MSDQLPRDFKHACPDPTCEQCNPMTKQCTCKAEHWQPHADACPAKVERMTKDLCMVCEGLCCGEIPRLNAEIARLREVLTIPNITPDTTSSALFIRTLTEHEKGQPVNAQDLINALMWRVKNQRKEIARLHATIGGES